jgi:hypothetical protein
MHKGDAREERRVLRRGGVGQRCYSRDEETYIIMYIVRVNWRAVVLPAGRVLVPNLGKRKREIVI